MIRHTWIVIALLSSSSIFSQSDADVMRYSMTGFGGSSRTKAMAGSFGALGADGSCMSINPAGIGLFKTGEINLSAGLRFNTVNAAYDGTKTNDFKANFVYNGFCLVKAFDGKVNPDNHHALGVSVNQLANFNSNTTIQGYSRNTRMNDILAQAQGQSPPNLDPSYSGMAFNNLILDTIRNTGDSKYHYYSFVDPTKATRQNDQIQTSGKYNELCFNYAYGFKEKLYIGATVGVPIVSFNYSSVYKETDDKDSIHVNGGTSTYPYIIYNYSGYGGFKEFSYTETYKTTGTGVNLKLGAIYRVTDYLRVGASYQSPTILKLNDTYQYQMSTSFDGGGGLSSSYPDNGGRFSYKIVTPQRVTGSIAYIYKKLGTINVDVESVNYSQGNLQNVSGGAVQADFSAANSTISNTYTRATNLRVGAEINVKPLFIRLGYAMYGSPYGDSFSGNLVRNYYTGGFGFRSNKWYFDFSLVKQISKDTYYMFNPKYADKSILSNSGTNIGATVGCKF